VVVRLEHIGSTSVPGLAAKPVIDMMASVRGLQDGRAAQAALAELGYELVATGMPDRLFYQRRAGPGMATHHLHVVAEDSWATRNERLLRDYLRAILSRQDVTAGSSSSWRAIWGMARPTRAPRPN
jgi:GrpB-like predicted nucleotidyltransferase (UPF0157 family)